MTLRTVVLTGVPGVGKSTVAKQCANAVDKITYYSMGDFMRRAAANAGDVRSDLYAVVTRPVIAPGKSLFIKEARHLSSCDGSFALLDSHTSTHGGVSVRLTPDSPDLLREFGLIGFIQLVAPPEVILKRRQADSSTHRHGATNFDVELAQGVMIASMVAAARQLTVPCHFVDAAGAMDDVLDRVKTVLRQLVEW